MNRFLTIGLTVLAVVVVASCDLFGGNFPGLDGPELQVIVEARNGNPAADMASGSEIDFGKPGFGLTEDIDFTIKNVGTANLILEGPGPDYVMVTDQNEAIQPFSLLSGAAVMTIVPGEQVTVTIRFAGQSDSTRYAAKLVIPSNDEEHPDYFLNLIGDGDGFN
jgi:hypothetical protein